MKNPFKLPKKNKFNARKTLVDGILFDSAKEAGRYKELKLLERAGHIKHLALQVPFIFEIDNKKMFTYYADFKYMPKNYNFFPVVEDVKSEITRKLPVYRLKKKIIEAYYNITISEI